MDRYSHSGDLPLFKVMSVLSEPKPSRDSCGHWIKLSRRFILCPLYWLVFCFPLLCLTSQDCGLFIEQPKHSSGDK